MGCSPRVDIVIKQVTVVAKMAHKSSKAEFCCKVSKFLRYLESFFDTWKANRTNKYLWYIFTFPMLSSAHGDKYPTNGDEPDV